nr:MAG: movement and silencing protein TGBp1 [Dracophyllum betaflexi-like virus]
MNMEVVLDKLLSKGFVRTCVALDFPVVVHAVPGAGKTSLLRELIAELDFVEVVTFGIPDPPNLSSRRIKAFSEGISEKPDLVLIVDEYITGKSSVPKCDFLFSDPIQNKAFGREAHFIKSSTGRFGKQTCELLLSFGFEVSSEKEDCVVIEGIFEGDLIGQVITCEEDCADLLRRHCVDFKLHCDILGCTFDKVTFVTSSSSIPDDRRSDFYISLTRHKSFLKILCPDASFCPA